MRTRPRLSDCVAKWGQARSAAGTQGNKLTKKLSIFSFPVDIQNKGFCARKGDFYGEKETDFKYFHAGIQ